MAAPPAPPLLLASTSPRRREILEQLRIPFDVVAPQYEETEDDPVAHALGKARSVLAEADGRPVLGCDTEVLCGGRVYGKPGGPEDAEEMLESLAGRTHEVVSGLALITPAWEEVRSRVCRTLGRSVPCPGPPIGSAPCAGSFTTTSSMKPTTTGSASCSTKPDDVLATLKFLREP